MKLPKMDYITQPPSKWTHHKGIKNVTIALAVMIYIGSCSCVRGREFLSPTDFVVLDRPEDTMMKNYLTTIIDRQFTKRASILATLKTAEDWGRHAEFIRDSMSAWTGPFPKRTPLRARVTGRIYRDRYTVEKVLFESRPNFFVTANLYLPKNCSGPRPAILNVIGHSPAGKATEHVQRRCIAQARKGFVALVIDAIGQGERQIRDYARISRPPGNAHQIVGTQAFLAGTHIFNFMVWDAIRAVDYLVSRPEVDPERIGCTGCSGGGMMTTYVLAFEPRIAVAVPACNPNTWSHRVHANLATDHEQVFFGSFAAGIDPRGDPLFAHVPKPLLINATTDDKLNPPSGVWDLSTWLYKAYTTHGVPHKFQTTMVKAPHGYNQEQREFAYAWMLAWLGGDASDFWEEEFGVEKEEDTWCTPLGNVYSEPESRQPHDLVLEYLKRHRPQWETIKTQEDLIRNRERLRTLVKEVLCLRDHVQVPEVEIKASRPVDRYKLTSVIIKPEKSIVLPGVWIESKGRHAKGPVILYLNDKGKRSLVDEKAILQALLDKGFRLFAVDLRGMGETALGMETKFWDFLAGQPIFGQRVEDVRAIVQWLSRPDVEAQGIYVWARGIDSLYAAMAATVEEAIKSMVLEQPLLAFEEVVTIKVPTYRHEIILPGVLEKFDLPQVYQVLCPISVTLINPLAGDKSLASKKDADKVYQQTAETYGNLGIASNWSVYTDVRAEQKSNLVLSAFTEMIKI